MTYFEFHFPHFRKVSNSRIVAPACDRGFMACELSLSDISLESFLIQVVFKNQWNPFRQYCLLIGLGLNYCNQGLSRYLETGCPNRGFIDFCVSKVWYKIHTTNKIDPIPLQILLFRPDTASCVLSKWHYSFYIFYLLRKVIFSKFWHKLLGVQTVKKQCSACPNDTLDALRLSPWLQYGLI